MPRGVTHLENLKFQSKIRELNTDTDPNCGGIIARFVVDDSQASVLVGDVVGIGDDDRVIIKSTGADFIGVVVGGQSLGPVEEAFESSDASELGAVAALANQWVDVMIRGICYVVSDGTDVITRGAIVRPSDSAAGQVETLAATAGFKWMYAYESITNAVLPVKVEICG